MLAHANSDATARLRRSKSASTVHKRPTSIVEPLDLDAIRQQALAAATTAFARAQAQDAIEHTNRRSSDLSRSRSNASRKSLTFQGNHFPPHHSGFRSVQATQAEQGKANQCKSQTYISHTKQITQKPSHCLSTPSSGELLSISQKSSTQHLDNAVENTKPTFQQKIARPSVASVTSQQIRKARSMYYASSIQTGSPIPRPPAKYLTPQPSESQSQELMPSPMHSSTRTLGRSTLTEPRMPVTVAPGVTLNEARDKHLQEFQEISAKHRPSMFLAPFKKRQDKAKDKAQSSSAEAQSFTVSRKDASAESSLDIVSSELMPQQDLKEKRSFSGSLKHRIKKVFRRTSVKPTDLPVQHIKASRQYFDTPRLIPSSIGDTSSIPCPDETTLRRIQSRTSSLEQARPAYLRSEYRSDSTGSGRSIRSLHSEVNAHPIPASRMTSWGTTSTSDTLTQRTINRMSVIHESKDSIGSEVECVSSTMALTKNSLPLSPLSCFRDPMPMHNLPEEESSPIDPKRVFSALMREIETRKSSHERFVPVESSVGAENVGLESSMAAVQNEDESSSSHHSIQTNTEVEYGQFQRQKTTSNSSESRNGQIRSFGKAIRSTIRAVTPAGQRLSPDSEPTNIVADDAIMHEKNKTTSSAIDSGTSSSQGGDSTKQQRQAPLVYIPSTSQIEKRIEKSRDRWKAPLESPENFQFPRETDKTYDVTAFVRQTCATPDDSTEKSKKLGKQDFDNIIEWKDRPPLSSGNLRLTSMEMPMSPSIYSRNTDGTSISLNGSVVSFDVDGRLEKPHNDGSALVLQSQSVGSYKAGTPSPQPKEVNHISRDWRAWLSHEISTMELSSSEYLTINGKYRNSSERDRSDSIWVSQSEDKDTTVVVVGDLSDASASPSETKTEMVTDMSHGANKSSELGTNKGKSTNIGATPSEKPNQFLDTPHIDDTSGSSSGITTTTRVHDTLKPRLDCSSSRMCLLSTSEVCVAHDAGIGTPKLTARNGQGLSTSIVQCSSNRKLAPRHPMSPTNNMASTSSPASTKFMHEETSRSRLSARSTNETSQHIATTLLNINDTQFRSKENLTPQSLNIQTQSTPSPIRSLPRPISHQLLNLSRPSRNSSSTDPLRATTPAITSTKSLPSSAAKIFNPCVHVTAHPISPDKRARRPKSALNLQATSSLESPTKITVFTTTSSGHHGCAYLNGSVVRSASSTTSRPLYKDLSLIRHDAGSVYTSESCTRSATPGHRMADRFLRQRNSIAGCEEFSGKRKEGNFLAREDTPAFFISYGQDFLPFTPFWWERDGKSGGLECQL